MMHPISTRQLEQQAMRAQLEEHDVTTWRIFMKRNELALVTFMLCHKLAKHRGTLPWAEYRWALDTYRRYTSDTPQDTPEADSDRCV